MTATTVATGTTHKAKLVADDGSISPLCAKKPKALEPPDKWSIVDDHVDCPRCLRKLGISRHRRSVR